MDALRSSDALPRDTALLILMPDAMVRGGWSKLAQRLSPLCLDVLATTALRLEPHLLTSLYAHGTFKQRRSASGGVGPWLSYRLGALDMAVPAVVRTPFDVDLAGLLDRWKGPSAPASRAEGDLRAVVGGSHRCLSLLHSSDNGDQAAKDIVTIFGTGILDSITGGSVEPRCSFADLSFLRMYQPLSDSPHPYELIRRCVTRAAALLAFDYRTEPDNWWSYFIRRCAVSRLPANAEAAASAWDDLAAALRGEVPPTRAAHPQLHSALRALLEPGSYSPAVCETVEHAFDTAGLYLDGWERHGLEVVLAFHPC